MKQMALGNVFTCRRQRQHFKRERDEIFGYCKNAEMGEILLFGTTL
jgi:hypothetical protein